MEPCSSINSEAGGSAPVLAARPDVHGVLHRVTPGGALGDGGLPRVQGVVGRTLFFCCASLMLALFVIGR